ncbi:MAG TPA: hypothetical protein VNV60_00235 [Holophagaceae bacterium]|nr:hypothetical protein [Holophagaceae bacterium]
MGARFWIRRSFLVYAGIFSVLLLVERMKGHEWRGALVFSGLWALISASIFIGTRLYYASRGQACAICRDTPEQG